MWHCQITGAVFGNVTSVFVSASLVTGLGLGATSSPADVCTPISDLSHDLPFLGLNMFNRRRLPSALYILTGALCLSTDPVESWLLESPAFGSGSRVEFGDSDRRRLHPAGEGDL